MIPWQDGSASKKAVISTTIGAEGLDVKHGENIILADSPRAFADSLCGVLTNNALRSKLERRGRNLVVQKYHWDALAHEMEKVWLRLAKFD